MTRQFTLRAETGEGEQVVITMAVTRDRMIAIRRTTPGVVLFTPRSISRAIAYLRLLQVEALDGETWLAD